MARLRMVATAMLISMISIPLMGLSARAADSYAPVPKVLQYQSHLMDANGLNVDGRVAVDVYLYDSPSGGHLLYAEQHGAIKVDRGILRFAVGEGVAVGSFTGAPLPVEALAARGAVYIEVHIDGERMLPRHVVGFHNAAIRAQYAKKADELSGDLHLIANNLPDLPASKVEGELHEARIPVLPASKLTGPLDPARMPDGIPVSRIVSGTLPSSSIPSLAAGDIQSGVFSTAQMPGVLLAKGDLYLASGIVQHGQYIPVPAGYSDCASIVSIQRTIGDHMAGGIDDIAVHTTGTLVTCQITGWQYPLVVTKACEAAYLIACVR